MASSSAKSIFICYSHVDEEVKKQLIAHLSALKRKGLVSYWHDREILPGQDWDKEIKSKIGSADIIIPLISSDFLASEYCIGTELTIAMQRHVEGKALLVPVIARPCDWHSMDFSAIQALPKDGKPITKWPDRDEAILDVINGLKLLIQKTDNDVPVKDSKDPLSQIKYVEDTVVCLLPRGYVEIHNIAYRPGNWDLYATYYHYDGQEIHSTHYATEYYKKSWQADYKVREAQLTKLQIPNADHRLAHHIAYLMISLGSRSENVDIEHVVQKHLQQEGDDVYFCKKGDVRDKPLMPLKYKRYVELSVLVDVIDFLDNALRVPHNGISEDYVRSVIESKVRDGYLFLEKKIPGHLFVNILQQWIEKFNPYDDYEEISIRIKRVKSLLEDARELI